MIKINASPKKLLSCGFIGIDFKYDWDDNSRRAESINCLLSFLDKDGYYTEHKGVIFVNQPGIETLILLKLPDRISKIYRSWDIWK